MTDATYPLEGRSVLIAGATGGLGSALAADLIGRGAHLTLVSRSRERLDALDVPGHRLAADLRLPGAAQSAVDAAVDGYGHLDVVINAVGVVAFGPVADLSVDALEELFLTNTFIPVFLAKAALAAFNETDAGSSSGHGDRGVIVNISGVVAEKNLPGMAAYGASKAGLWSFDQALQREARRNKVRVIDARPPHTETGLATRPIEGEAPRMPSGLDPAAVAATICDAIAKGHTDLPSSSFSPDLDTDR